MASIEISQVDIENLRLIRLGVRDLIRNAAESIDASGVLVLDVAPQIHQGVKEYFRLSNVETLDIDPSSGATYIADLCEDNSALIPSDYFDVIVCTEVLEHVINPFGAVDELRRILKPGGICFVSTPFNLRIHGPLPDCWRFTEYGIRTLFRKFSSVSIEATDDFTRPLMPIHYKTKAIK